MRHELPQLVEGMLPILVPALAGVAVFLFAWLLLRHMVRGVGDSLVPGPGTSRPVHVQAAPRVPLEPYGTGGIAGPAGWGSGAGPLSEPVAWGRDGSAPANADAARREHHLAQWREAEARFEREPRAAVEQAERLVRELTRDLGSASVVRALMREQGSRPATASWPTEFRSDADFGAALAEVGIGIFRRVRRARAKAHDRDLTAEHRDASADDYRARMDRYRGLFTQLLDAEHGEVGPLGAAALSAPGDGVRDPTYGRPDRASAGRETRERSFVKWYVLQLVLSLVFGVTVCALLFWVLRL